MRQVSRILCALIFVNIIPQCIFATSYPQDFGFSNRLNYLIDAGLQWESNSLFHPLTSKQPLGISPATFCDSSGLFQPLNWFTQSVDSARTNTGRALSAIGQIGVDARYQSGPDRIYTNPAWSPFIWCTARFQQKWYVDFIIRSTNEAASLQHYSAPTRSISRVGFNSSEIDRWSFGYRNDWATVEFGRGREIVGPMAEENLALSGNSPAFERLVLEAKHKDFTYRYFYGFLETVADTAGNTQRYLVGRTLEYNNHENIIIGLTELSVLAGLERPVDWAFLNPLAFHVEIEQNNRDNNPTTNGENGLWVLNGDWRVSNQLRVAASVLLDDFQLDGQDRKKAQDQLGYLAHLAWTPIRNPIVFTVLADYIRIGTYTTQHNSGYTNFVNRGIYLGHPLGNDADLAKLGVRLILKQPVAIEAALGQRRQGENSMRDNPYLPRRGGAPHTSFPSGAIRTVRFFEFNIDSQPWREIAIGIQGEIDLMESGVDSGAERIIFTVSYAIPFEY